MPSMRRFGHQKNLATMAPSDDEPCPCTYEDDSEEELTLSRDRENLVYKIT